jgi:hypothetical protein
MSTDRYHIEGIHSLEDTIDYIFTHQPYVDNHPLYRMSIQYRQIIDLIEMGAIKKHGEDRYEFVNLTREALDVVLYPSYSWPKWHRDNILKNRNKIK